MALEDGRGEAGTVGGRKQEVRPATAVDPEPVQRQRGTGEDVPRWLDADDVSERGALPHPTGADDEDVPQRLAKLSFPEQTLIALDAFSSEFENGGIHQFFFNSTGAFAPEVLAGLRALNLTQQAQLFERAMKTFPSPYPRDRDKRAASYLGHRDLEGFESELAELTDEFYAADTAQPNSKPHSATNATGLRSAILRYAEAHKLLPC